MLPEGLTLPPPQGTGRTLDVNQSIIDGLMLPKGLMLPSPQVMLRGQVQPFLWHAPACSGESWTGIRCNLHPTMLLAPIQVESGWLGPEVWCNLTLACPCTEPPPHGDQTVDMRYTWSTVFCSVLLVGEFETASLRPDRDPNTHENNFGYRVTARQTVTKLPAPLIIDLLARGVGPWLEGYWHSLPSAMPANYRLKAKHHTN